MVDQLIDRYKRNDKYRDVNGYMKADRRNDRSNSKVKNGYEFFKSMGYHPLDKCYDYIHA